MYCKNWPNLPREKRSLDNMRASCAWISFREGCMGVLTVNTTGYYLVSKRDRPQAGLMKHFLTFVLSAALAGGQTGPDWAVYRGKPGRTPHSPLDQIRPDNVKRLKLAWQYHTGDVVDQKQDPRSSFQAAPLLIEGKLYVVTPLNKIIALEPHTGRELWKFDPKIRREGDYGDGFV